MFERKMLCPLYVAKDGPCMKKKKNEICMLILNLIALMLEKKGKCIFHAAKGGHCIKIKGLCASIIK